MDYPEGISPVCCAARHTGPACGAEAEGDRTRVSVTMRSEIGSASGAGQGPGVQDLLELVEHRDPRFLVQAGALDDGGTQC